MARSAKAIRFQDVGQPDVLKIEDVQIPPLNGNKVLVRIQFAGLNRVDAMVRAGYHRTNLSAPIIPGMEGSGVVEDVGRDVKEIKKGDRVIVYTRRIVQNGTCAQLCVLDEECVFKLPDRYSLEEGAAIPLAFMTSYCALVLRAQVQPFEIVLVNGCSGAVGLAAIDICKTLGVKVVGTAGHAESLEAIRDQGGLALNYKESDMKKKLEELIGAEKGIDVAIEVDAHHVPVSLSLLDAKGRLVLLSKPSKETIDFGKILIDELSIMGMRVTEVNDDHFANMSAALNKALQAGTLHPRVEKVFRMEEIQKAHGELLQPSRGRTGKLEIDMRS